MSVFNFIMDHFDDLPHADMESPPTGAKFVSMVRTLLGQPQAKMNHAQFGKLFKGAKKVFLKPFFTLPLGKSSFATLILRMFTSVRVIIGNLA